MPPPPITLARSSALAGPSLQYIAGMQNNFASPQCLSFLAPLNPQQGKHEAPTQAHPLPLAPTVPPHDRLFCYLLCRLFDDIGTFPPKNPNGNCNAGRRRRGKGKGVGWAGASCLPCCGTEGIDGLLRKRAHPFLLLFDTLA